MNKLAKFVFQLLSVLLVMTLTTTSYAQNSKHPRVSEVEKVLTKDALDLLKSRFPDHPFMVQINIDPLHREKNKNDNEDKLPYYSLDSEEILDEWDDLNVSDYALVNRVKKINIVLSVSSQLSDDEIAEIKQSMSQTLGLLDARDNIEVRKRNFGGTNWLSSLNWWQVSLLGACFFMFFMAGMFAISVYFSGQISKSIKNIKIDAHASGSNQPPAPLMSINDNNTKNSNNNSSSDFKISDPLKMKEVVISSIMKLKNDPLFPQLEDMIIMQEACVQDSGSFGALISEFPTDLKNKIFSYSYSTNWLVAMTYPTDLNSNALVCLNRLMRQNRKSIDEITNDILLALWRMDLNTTDFFKSIKQNEAFYFLAQLPSSIALKLARENYPGAWGVLLDSNFTPQPISTDRMVTFYNDLMQSAPLRNLKSLEKFKHEKDLLTYLHTADVTTEKEIYMACSKDSAIPVIRPPFYKILESESDDLKSFFPQVTVDDWAICLYNVQRSERKTIESFFNEKQKFRFLEVLKNLDTIPSNRELVGLSREKVAKKFNEFMKIHLSSKHLNSELNTTNEEKTETAA